MGRVNVVDGNGNVEGWFDASAAQEWAEGTRWDGDNHVSLATGARLEHERLLRTAGGRWVVHRWSQWVGVPDSLRYVDVDEAVRWLVACEYDAAAIKDATGVEIPAEWGPERAGAR